MISPGVPAGAYSAYQLSAANPGSNAFSVGKPGNSSDGRNVVMASGRSFAGPHLWRHEQRLGELEIDFAADHRGHREVCAQSEVDRISADRHS